jgi:hypothetical protein
MMLANAAGVKIESSAPRYAFMVAVSSQSCRITRMLTTLRIPLTIVLR